MTVEESKNNGDLRPYPRKLISEGKYILYVPGRRLHCMQCGHRAKPKFREDKWRDKTAD
jgi:hypothetical protein